MDDTTFKILGNASVVISIKVYFIIPVLDTFVASVTLYEVFTAPKIKKNEKNSFQQPKHKRTLM